MIEPLFFLRKIRIVARSLWLAVKEGLLNITKKHTKGLHNRQRSVILHPVLKKEESAMKKGIHPESYRTVVFKDFSCDESWLSRSCAPTRETIVWEDGNEYPLIKLEISSMSHPFFTGKMKFVDTAGRIDKFNKKFANTRFSKPS